MRKIFSLIYVVGLFFMAINCQVSVLWASQIIDSGFCDNILKERDGYNIMKILDNIKIDINEKEKLLACVKKMIPQWAGGEYGRAAEPALISMAYIIYRYGDADDLSVLYPLIDYRYPVPTGLRHVVYNTLGRHGDQHTLDFILKKEPDLTKDRYYEFLERAKVDIELRIISLNKEEVLIHLQQKDGAGIQDLLDAGDKSYFGLLDIIGETEDPVIMTRALETIGQLSVEKHHIREVLSWRSGEVSDEIRKIIQESEVRRSVER